MKIILRTIVLLKKTQNLLKILEDKLVDAYDKKNGSKNLVNGLKNLGYFNPYYVDDYEEELRILRAKYLDNGFIGQYFDKEN